MDNTPTTGPPDPQADLAFQRQLREMNEALLLSSVRQHELTERAIRAEAAAAHLAAIVTSSDDAIISKGLDGVITSWNRGAQRLFGYAAEEVIGKLVSLLIPRDRLDEELRILERIRRGESTENHETVRRRKDGTTVDISLTVSPLRDAAGRIIGASKIARDITERRHADQALRDALAYADNIIASLRHPFMVLDTTLRIVTANRSFYQNYHVTPEETQGQVIYDLGNRQWDIPRLRTLLEDANVLQDFEVEHDFPAIGRKCMLLNARRIRNPGNNAELILLAIEDITERSRLERKTQELLAELSDRNRRKDEFLAMLGHELRNPLAPILNAVQLLQLQGGEGGPQQQAHAIIERQVGQLVHLVDDLLEVSRIATGRIHLQPEQLDMRAIVECGVETVRPLIEQRRHALNIRLPPSPIWINGDATRLEQVVVNLLNNAAKYTNEGGHIWLSLQQEGNEAVLQVRDSGAGIDPELMPRIFDLFTQAERSLARSQGGLGVGLSLVQRLVEMHGGKVTVHSSLGRGSEFVVRLPVVLIPVSQPPPRTETGQPTARPLRVLVVDDSVDTAESVALLLLAAGHDVRTAYDGPQALEAALDYIPNVVLLDIGLPGLDGYEVAKQMRKQFVLQNVVLVAMTGYGQETDRQRSQEAGFDHHLVKPPRFEKVEEILASISPQAT